MYGLFETLRNLGIGTRHSLAIPVTESGNALGNRWVTEFPLFVQQRHGCDDDAHGGDGCRYLHYAGGRTYQNGDTHNENGCREPENPHGPVRKLG